jgi:hypothetical protein
LLAEDAITPLGDLTLLEALTQNASSDLVRFSLVLQAELTSRRGVNSFTWTYEMVYLIDLPEFTPEVPDAASLRSDAEWVALLPRGSQWEFNVSGLPYTTEAILDGSIFQSERYRTNLVCFTDSHGNECADGPLLLPVGIVDVPRFP